MWSKVRENISCDGMRIDLVVSPDLVANFAFGEKIMYRFSEDRD